MRKLDISSISCCDCNPNSEDPLPCSSQSNCMNRMLMYECHPQVCNAKEKCCNQRFQRREYPKSEIFKTPFGWGLRTLVDIKKVGPFCNACYMFSLTNIFRGLSAFVGHCLNSLSKDSIWQLLAPATAKTRNGPPFIDSFSKNFLVLIESHFAYDKSSITFIVRSSSNWLIYLLCYVSISA